jgi:hypothetical protein
MTEQEALQFHREGQAATGLLMLHSYDDLDIDISNIAKQYSPLSDIRFFLARPDRGDKGGKEQDEVEAAPSASETKIAGMSPASHNGSAGGAATGDEPHTT